MKKNIMERSILWNNKGCKKEQDRKAANQGQTKNKIKTIGVILGVFLLIGAMVGPLCAQSYPDKPIRLIIAFAAGGPADTLGRIIATKLSERLGQPIVPENRGGAGGNIAIGIATRTKPDGYTLLLVSQAMTMSCALYEKVGYDPIKDLDPIALVAGTPMSIVVRQDLPVKNLKELVEYAKANPGKLKNGSAGIGAVNHLTGEYFKSLAGVNIMHVPYKGTGPAMTAMMGGEIDMMVTGVTGPYPHVQSGKLRALALLSRDRVSFVPDIPTAKEGGMDNFVVSNWFGFLAPAGTPRDIINHLNKEIFAIPDLKKILDKAKYELLGGTPEQFSEHLKEDLLRWEKVVKDAKIPKVK
ncbi:MAG: tripartite tricarboxylate transporter substrate binding protein [Pseudomonadota bacterium]